MRANEDRTLNKERVFNAFRDEVTGNSVLHIGCVAHDPSKIDDEDEVWMHDLIGKHAEECVGIDIHEEGVEEMQDRGYNAMVADAQDFYLDRQFDTIIAGELIEHLTNFDGFLRSVKTHLRSSSSGSFVLTTPNAMALHWTGLRALNAEFVNTEHTCWFDETTISQLLARYDLTVERVDYVGDCSITLQDPLYSVGRIVELVAPSRIGKSTLIAFADHK